jgi:site-specific recombinase XerC
VTGDALAAPIESYLDHLRVERRYAAGTIVNYARALADLLAYARNLQIRHWRELKPTRCARGLRACIAAA